MPRRGTPGRGIGRRQHPRRAGRGGSHPATAAASSRDGKRRDLDRTGNRVPVGRRPARARCRHRAECRIRPGGHGRRQCADPRLLASRRRDDCRGRDCRPFRAAASRRGARTRRACRQFCRGQGDPARGRRQGQSSLLSRRQRDRRRNQYRRRHDHLQLRRLQQAPDGDRRKRVYRIEHGLCRTGDGRRRRLCRDRQRRHRGCAKGRVDDRAGAAGEQARPRRRAQGQIAGKESLMCGIIGIIAKKPVADELVGALKRLEYRGYDSAGIATLINGRIERRRAEGKLSNLVARLEKEPVRGTIGIGHTRWATHGQPIEKNAHPIATDKVAVVHNGIIENFQALKKELVGLGYSFQPDTDTEAVANLVTHYLSQGLDPTQAVAKTLARLEGAFALVFLFAGRHDLLICARRGSPLAIGFGDGEMFIGSDALALAPLTRRICYLEEGDWAVLSARGATLYDSEDRKVERAIRETAPSGALIGKGNHRHFMQKEIFEQPSVIGDTLHALFNPTTRSVNLGALPFDLAALSKVTIIACGTSFHAGMIAKYWLERIARVPVEIDIASEFRYRAPDMPAGGLALFISQSGETADTLAALRYARGQK